MSGLIPLALVRKIEYALLSPLPARAEIEAACGAAARADCYAVVVKPHYVELARKLLKDTGVKTISVTGSSHGGTTTATKMYETQDLYQRGADEISLVINLGALRDHDDLLVHNDIATVVRTARGRPITVVLEASVLTAEEQSRACRIADKAGATFVQTCTGAMDVPVTPDDVRLLREASPRLQVKAAGQILDLETAAQMLEAGAARVLVDLLES